MNILDSISLAIPNPMALGPKCAQTGPGHATAALTPDSFALTLTSQEFAKMELGRGDVKSPKAGFASHAGAAAFRWWNSREGRVAHFGDLLLVQAPLR